MTYPKATLEEVWALFKETDRQFKQLSQETNRRFKETDLKFQETDRKFQEIALRFQETDRQFKETDLKFQETDRKFQETALRFQETDRQFKETDLKFQETDRKFQETALRFQETDRQFKETDRQFKETDRQFKDTDRKLKELTKKIGDLGGRLGDFVEGLIRPSVVKLFQQRGIAVHKVLADIEANNQELGLATQIDLLVVNRDICVIIEVKSRLSVDDINEHLERMEKFKPLFPEYQDKQVFGAVAAMVIAEDVARYGYRKGFFVIGQQGENAVILNDEKFKPMAW